MFFVKYQVKEENSQSSENTDYVLNRRCLLNNVYDSVANVNQVRGRQSPFLTKGPFVMQFESLELPYTRW